MKYTLKTWKQNGSIKDSGDGTSTMPIIITPQIEGDEYGFISPDPQKNMTSFNFPNKGADADQISDLGQVAAEKFCAVQYPNI